MADGQLGRVLDGVVEIKDEAVAQAGYLWIGEARLCQQRRNPRNIWIWMLNGPQRDVPGQSLSGAVECHGTIQQAGIHTRRACRVVAFDQVDHQFALAQGIV